MDATFTAYSGTSATSIKIISGGRAGQTVANREPAGAGFAGAGLAGAGLADAASWLDRIRTGG